MVANPRRIPEAPHSFDGWDGKAEGGPVTGGEGGSVAEDRGGGGPAGANRGFRGNTLFVYMCGMNDGMVWKHFFTEESIGCRVIQIPINCV